MPLAEVPYPEDDAPLPPDVRRFLRDADRRIEDFLYSARVPAFVPSDYPSAYRILKALNDHPVARGNRFCEWGSGYGVVTCLAAMLGFEAVGIEIDAGLVDCARRLAEAYTFLRRVEHRIQYLDDQQTHVLAGCDDDLTWIARTMGFANCCPFLSELDTHRELVAQEFDKLLGGGARDCRRR